MNRIALSTVLVFLLGFASCDKNETGSLELNFLATFQGQPLVVLQPYEYPSGDISIMFQRFNFYVADITLTNGSGEATEVWGIDYLDFDNIANEDAAKQGVAINIPGIPTDDYSSISIGLGVPSDLNATKESDYEDSHPLGRESHYWPAWESYIFCMTNAKLDTNGDGMHDDAAILYHTGSDEVFRTVTISTPVNILADTPTSLTFTIDLMDLMKDADGAPFDLLANPDTHDISNLDLANQIMDNFAAALKIVN